MPKIYHILNGDALNEQFPRNIKGEIIVMRECLIEGGVSGSNLESFFTTRSHFFKKHYGITHTEYTRKSVSELQKITTIKAGAEVHLWFEDDLFCQVHFWFAVHLLQTDSRNCNLFLIRPPELNHYGFGGYDSAELSTLFQNRMPLNQKETLAKLWNQYQSANLAALENTANVLKKDYPFIQKAVQAHIARIPTATDPGKPIASLKAIMNELNTHEFGPVFQEFCKRESIYGFGDIQVKKMYDEIMKSKIMGS